LPRPPGGKEHKGAQGSSIHSSTGYREHNWRLVYRPTTKCMSVFACIKIKDIKIKDIKIKDIKIKR